MRGLFASLAAPITKASSGVPAQGLIPSLGSISSAAGMLVSQSTAMTVSTAYASVTTIAKDVARCTPSVYRKLADGSRETVEDHPVARLFEAPNRVQTWFEFAEQMVAALQLRSNAYAAILRDRRGDPVELIPINPDAVMVLEAQDGQIFYNVNRLGLFQLAVLRDFDVAIPAEDMLHIRDLTFNMLVAVSRIGMARDAIGVAMGLEQQAARWMGAGARPSGVLKSPKQLTPDAANRLKAQWQSLTSGVQNTGQTVVLEEGLEWSALSLDAVSLDFLKQREFSVLDVARFFGVPPHRLGLPLQGRTPIGELEQAYVNNTIAPIIERIEQKLERSFDLRAEGLRVNLDEGRLLRADPLTRANIDRLRIVSGTLTPNEARANENLPPVEGGDRLLVPSNTAALGSDMTGTAPDAAGRPAPGGIAQPGVGTGGDQPGAEPVGDDTGA